MAKSKAKENNIDYRDFTNSRQDVFIYKLIDVGVDITDLLNELVLDAYNTGYSQAEEDSSNE